MNIPQFTLYGNNNYFTRPNNYGMNYGLMYNATTPSTNSILDSIIQHQLSNLYKYREKGELLRKQKEAEQLSKQQQQRYNDYLQNMQQMAAVGNAVKQGASLIDRLTPSSKANVEAPTQNALPSNTYPTGDYIITNKLSPMLDNSLLEFLPKQTEVPTVQSDDYIIIDKLTPNLTNPFTQDSKPSAIDNGEFGGGKAPDIKSSNQQSFINQIQDSVDKLNQKIDVTESQLKDIESQIYSAADEQDEDLLNSLVDKYNKTVETGKQLTSNLKNIISGAANMLNSGFNLYSDISGVIKNPNVENIAGTAVDVGQLGSKALAMAGYKPVADVMGKASSVGGGLLGVGQGISNIIDNPDNPAGYTNLGIGALNLASEVAPLLATEAAATGAGTAAGAGTATSGISSTLGAVAPPLAVLSFAEGLRGAFGGVGKPYEKQSQTEFVFNTPVAAVLAPMAKAIGGTLGDWGQMLSGGERIAMAPINWLFGDKSAFNGKAFSDLAEGFTNLFKGLFGGLF